MDTKLTKIYNVAIHKDDFANIINDPKLEELYRYTQHHAFFIHSGDFRIHICDAIPDMLCNLLTDYDIWFQLHSYELFQSIEDHFIHNLS